MNQRSGNAFAAHRWASLETDGRFHTYIVRNAGNQNQFFSVFCDAEQRRIIQLGKPMGGSIFTITI